VAVGQANGTRRRETTANEDDVLKDMIHLVALANNVYMEFVAINSGVLKLVG
jgi:hypothetical protein